MTLPPDTPAGDAACASCGGGLGPDQRYCLNCGAATPVAATSDVRGLLAPAVAAALVAPPAGSATTPARLAVLPGREVSLGLAVGVFALVLGLAAWAGATTTGGPGPAPIAIAAAPATASTPTVTATAAPADVAEAAPPTADLPLETTDAPLTDVPVADAPAASTDAGTEPTTGGDDPETGGPTTPADGDVAAEPAVPRLKHVWLISLTGQGYETLFDPDGAGPYLAKDLTAKGTLLSRYFAVTTGGMANGVALVSGQGPNAATQADCPTVSDVTPGTVGENDQAAGSGCLYSTDVFSIADLLAARALTWRAYAGALDTAGACPRPVAGSRFPAPRVPFLAFRTITEDAACADRITGLGRLATDLAAATGTPALSYIVPGPCEDGSPAPCAPGTAAGLPPADAFLRRTVPAIMGSPAYKDGGAIVIFSDHAPQGGPSADTSACCGNRPWQGEDVATGGGGRTGALVLSPFAKGGAVVDTALDHYDLLKTVALGLAVRPRGYAARSEVTGLPRETWGTWKPTVSASRR